MHLKGIGIQDRRWLLIVSLAVVVLLTVWIGGPASAAPLSISVEGQVSVGGQIVTTPGGWATMRVSIDGDQANVTWSAEDGDLRPSGHTALWVAPKSPGRYRITVSATDGSHSVEEMVSVIVLDPPLEWVENAVTVDETSQTASWALGGRNTSDRTIVDATLVAVLLGSSGETVSLIPTLSWSPSSSIDPGNTGGVRYGFPDDRVAEAYVTILNITFSDGTEWNWTTN